VQQVGTPLELYDTPNNKFVASFIGLPPMNMFDVQFRDGALYGKGFQVSLTDEQKDTLAAYNGKTITLGVRPEDIAEGGDLTIQVATNENLGMNTLVHGAMGEGNRVTAKLRGWAKYGRGDSVKVHFNKMHFFDQDTEKAIRKEAK
jgi:multiple sugar transport system ATP-binding protein